MAAVLSHDELEGFAESLRDLLAMLHEELADELNAIEHARYLLKRPHDGQSERQVALALARRLNLTHMAGHLDAIAGCNEALERINRGTYGRCRRCGEGVELNRLRADPLTDTCLCCHN